MSTVALTTFIELTNASGVVQQRFQNSKPSEAITHRGVPFPFLSFLYQGATQNRTGDNLESALVLANNQISIAYVLQAVQNRWNVRVDTCLMNPSDFSVARTLASEFWLASSMTYDPVTVEVLLSSGIDAVGANAPTRVLTTALVGQLPVTGQIFNR